MIKLIKPAYETKLGNSTAKNVLTLLAHEVNARGYGWPSVEYIARCTEASPRTVLRIIQVFAAIGLLAKVTSPHHGFAVQLDLDKLGKDLSVEFRKAHAAAHRSLKSMDERCTDSGTVPRTQNSVPGTQNSVPGTVPPHPLIGGPIIDPLLTQKTNPPIPPARRGVTIDSDHDPPWQRTNRAVAADRNRALELAVDSLMQACGFAKGRLRPGLRAAIAQESDKGTPPATVALEMAAAWKKQSEKAHLLRVKYTNPLNFFGLGIWKDVNLWHWDLERIESLQAARVGSLQ